MVDQRAQKTPARTAPRLGHGEAHQLDRAGLRAQAAQYGKTEWSAVALLDQGGNIRIGKITAMPGSIRVVDIGGVLGTLLERP